MLLILCSFQWVANPVNDMYADAVLAVILQVESNPTTAQGNCYGWRHNFVSYVSVFCRGPLASYKNRMQLSPVNNGPFGQYGGHLEFYFKYLLWDAQGANTHKFVPWASHNSFFFETIELKMAALSPRRFEWRNRPRSIPILQRGSEALRTKLQIC